jgi:hypothetical protein
VNQAGALDAKENSPWPDEGNPFVGESLRFVMAEGEAAAKVVAPIPIPGCFCNGCDRNHFIKASSAIDNHTTGTQT